MSKMFWFPTEFNQKVSHFDVSKVKTMYSLFVMAVSFKQNLSGWSTLIVMDMSGMFWVWPIQPTCVAFGCLTCDYHASHVLPSNEIQSSIFAKLEYIKCNIHEFHVLWGSYIQSTHIAFGCFMSHCHARKHV